MSKIIIPENYTPALNLYDTPVSYTHLGHQRQQHHLLYLCRGLCPGRHRQCAVLLLLPPGYSQHGSHKGLQAQHGAHGGSSLGVKMCIRDRAIIQGSYAEGNTLTVDCENGTLVLR